MENAIRKFHTQFSWQPEVRNRGTLSPITRFIVCGMGGSALTPGLLTVAHPEIDILTHRGYGLPAVARREPEEYLCIASSYSGNTEETVDCYATARAEGMRVAVIASGGRLLAEAEKDGVPHVVLPASGIQPRSATGYSLRALLALMGREDLVAETEVLAETLDPGTYEEKGRELAERLHGRVPVIAVSLRNFPLAYNWKIKLNETGKTPAFCSAFPELNHNEMTGFDPAPALVPGGDVERSSTREKLNLLFAPLMLTDSADDPRVQKRMRITERLYAARGMAVISAPLSGAGAWEKIFSSLLLADWTALYTARRYGLEPEQVPLVEEFKRLMASPE